MAAKLEPTFATSRYYLFSHLDNDLKGYPFIDDAKGQAVAIENYEGKTV